MWGAALAARQYPLAFKQAGVRIASGSSIYGLGAPPDAPQGWPITIRTPRDPSGVATHVVLKNMSLSTSGSYEKFVEESEGTHRSDTFAEAGIEDRYYRFLSEFWRLAASVPERIRFVREIDSARQLVLRPDGTPVFNQLAKPFAITSMDYRDNVATFSPELLGLKNAHYQDFIIGNINRETLAEMADSPVLRALRDDIAAGVALCRERCEYFSVCGGGEPVNKLFENGSFVSTETMYCRMTKMRTTDLVLDRLEEVLGPGAGSQSGCRAAVGIRRSPNLLARLHEV